MDLFFRKNRKPIETVPPTVPTVDETGKLNTAQTKFSTSLAANRELLRSVFRGDATLVIRDFASLRNPGLRCFAAYLDGMVNLDMIRESVIRPVITAASRPQVDLSELMCNILFTSENKRTTDPEAVITAILNGDTAVFMDGVAEAVTVGTKGYQSRSVEEPDNERTMSGPREGFTEVLMTNASLLRRRLKTSDLKMEAHTFGTRSGTRVFVCYLDSLVNHEVLEELNRRLDRIRIDGVLDVNYLQEQIKDHRFSIFRTTGTSEKPDTVAANLLEGRIAIMVDGSPVVMTVPYLFIENFQASQDYYMNFWQTSVGRLLRMLSYFLSFSVPALYVALVTFHKELIPTELELNISAARNGVPFPVTAECIFMLIVFEILREASIRMPSSVGQTLSIVGALVVGQAAVDAKIVSATMLIVVAFSGITGLIVSDMSTSITYLRFGFIIFASVYGLYGYFFGLLCMILYLCGMKSFGVLYTSEFLSYRLRDQKDLYVRFPWFAMRTRPQTLARDTVRQGQNGGDVCE